MVPRARGHVELQAVHKGEQLGGSFSGVALRQLVFVRQSMSGASDAFSPRCSTVGRCSPARTSELSTPDLRLAPLTLPSFSHHQLSLILDVLGTPSIADFQKITSRRSRDYLNGLPLRSKKHFEHIYKDANPLAIDFLKKTLTCRFTSFVVSTARLILLVRSRPAQPVHDRAVPRAPLPRGLPRPRGRARCRSASSRIL